MVIPGSARADQGPRGPSGHVEPDRLAGGRRARHGGRSGRAPRRRPATWRPFPGTGSRRRDCRRRGSRARRPLRATVRRAQNRAPIDWILPASSPSREAASPRRGPGRMAGVLDPARAIIMAGRPLSQVATPEHPFAPRQRPDQPAEDDRGVIAIGQAVHHPGRSLRPAVAGVGDHPGERHDIEPAQLLGRLLDEQADLPVPRVISQRDRLAIGRAQPALGAQDQDTDRGPPRSASSPYRRSASGRRDRRRASP